MSNKDWEEGLAFWRAKMMRACGIPTAFDRAMKNADGRCTERDKLKHKLDNDTAAQRILDINELFGIDDDG